MDYSPPGSSVHGITSGKNSGVGCHFLLQGIFVAQGPKPSLLTSPASADGFFTTGATWEAPSASDDRPESFSLVPSTLHPAWERWLHELDIHLFCLLGFMLASQAHVHPMSASHEPPPPTSPLQLMLTPYLITQYWLWLQLWTLFSFRHGSCVCHQAFPPFSWSKHLLLASLRPY